MAAPLDDFRALLKQMPPFDRVAFEQARAARRRLPLADGALGRLEQVVPWLSGVTGKTPTANRPLIALFAGSHSVEEALADRSPALSATAFVERAGRGQAAVNQICAASDVGLKVLDVAIDHPVGDIRTEDALDERSCAATLAFGMEAVAGGPDLVCLGAVGEGGSTAIPVLLAALMGGTWKDDGASPRHAEAYNLAVARARDGAPDAFEIMRRVGGRELTALVGSILAARMERIPVILDGGVAAAAAAVLAAADPASIHHCAFAAPVLSSRFMIHPTIRELGILTDFDLPEGEGISAALTIGLVRNAITVHGGLLRSLQ